MRTGECAGRGDNRLEAVVQVLQAAGSHRAACEAACGARGGEGKKMCSGQQARPA